MSRLRDDQPTSLRIEGRNKLAVLFGVGYQIIALLSLVVIIVSARRWLQTPFIGAFVENTLVFNALGPIQQGNWNGKNAGLDFGHHLLEIDGEYVRSADAIQGLLRGYSVGDVISLTVLSRDGELNTIKTTLQPFPVMDRVGYLYLPLGIGLIYLLCGLWVWLTRSQDASARVFALFANSMFVATAGWFDGHTTHRLTYLWTISLALGGGALLHLTMIFPREEDQGKSTSFLRWIGYTISMGLIGYSLPKLFDLQRPWAYLLAWRLEYIYLGLSALIFIIGLSVRRIGYPEPIARKQRRMSLSGAVLSFTPLMFWFTWANLRSDILFTPYLLLPLFVFPLAVLFAIKARRLPNQEVFVYRAVLYGLIIVLMLGGYILLVSGLGLILSRSISANDPLAIGLMVVLLALMLNPVRNRLRELLDRSFFRGQRAYLERARAFNRELKPTMDLDSIVHLTRQYIEESLNPSVLHIFIHDPLRDFYVAMSGEDDRPTTDLHFSINSVLPHVLASRDSAIILSDDGSLPEELEPERARLALLGAKLFVPFPGRDERVLGWLALGPRRSGEPYANLDLDYLESLSEQTALALERVQVVLDLERRVQELNVLTRLSQGINVTLAFDNILELIYAQTTRLIPVSDFWITLFDKDGGFYYHAFYLENDTRILEREKRPLRGELGLLRTVVESGRPLCSDDYEQECRSRGVLPIVGGLYAWIGIPLVVGDESIGALSLASRDPAEIFTEEQNHLLQAIADQAAGAIDKARLLEESERRTRQMEMLNEVGRSLTSTLNIEALLEQVLGSAVDILDAEAGTLFLVDERTGDLISEVGIGPVGDEMVGMLLPPGTGHVGKVAKSGQPTIVNDAQNTVEWPLTSGENYASQTRDLLLVPIKLKDRIIGVIEVINKLDGSPFTSGDQELLTAFTGQVAVAYENARLYTLTDMKLADRVDELSVLQRIDRELNDSLDIGRAMHITLEWAMGQSQADAGLVGIVEDEGVRMMASQGYTTELDPYDDTLLPLHLPALRNAIHEEATQLFNVNRAHNGFCLLTDAKSQLVIPIRREERVIGVILLESREDDPWEEDIQVFLSRLSDHAAIAIANARLYAEVQDANLAKSEFVSLVSHELRTPMTSIKGYTDLLINKSVGDVNEAQVNFLHTIRSNINRMHTLVSDLADVSRIESGRLRLDFEAVSIPDVLDEVLRSNKGEIDAKDLKLELDIPDDLSKVWGDHTRLVQVLTNLISNAYKYTPEGGRISVHAEQVSNRWDPGGSNEVVHISVEDTGIGINPDEHEHVFEKFFRSEDTRAREAPGTGLGLNITNYLVEMQGGRIWFESEYEVGTTFHFTIPVVKN